MFALTRLAARPATTGPLTAVAASYASHCHLLDLPSSSRRFYRSESQARPGFSRASGERRPDYGPPRRRDEDSHASQHGYKKPGHSRGSQGGYQRRDSGDRSTRERQGGDGRRGYGIGGAQGLRGSPRTRDALPRDDWIPRQAETPYAFSKKVRTWIDRHQSPLSQAQVDEVVRMVSEAPLTSVNAPVWNLVLSLLGREGKYARMWKEFNTKRGVAPTSRTFTTLLNAYAGLSHSEIPMGQFTPAHRPEQLTIDRVKTIYNQSQSHIQKLLSTGDAEEPEELGIAYAAQSTEKKKIGNTEAQAIASQVNNRPTNAYLKFLGRFGMWEEMDRVFLAMDRTGALSPDQTTYSTMLITANNIDHYRRANATNDHKANLAPLDLGATAHRIFDQAVRQMCTKSGKSDGGRELDVDVALAALQCFSLGRPADQRLLEALIPRLFRLPAPGQPAGSRSGSSSNHPGIPAAWANLPTFDLNVRIATQLMSLLGRTQNNTMSAHYTNLILGDKRLQKDLDLPALRVAVRNLAIANDCDAALAILDSYQPQTGAEGWPLDVWHSVLSACRWGRDWDGALAAFRRMVHLPLNVETGKGIKPYTWTSPNGNKQDVRGKPWIAARPRAADAQSLDTLLKTALAAQRSQGIKPLRQAINVFEHYAGDAFVVSRTVQSGRKATEEALDLRDLRHPEELSAASRRAIADRVELAKDAELVAERLCEAPKDEEDLERLRKLRKEAGKIADFWSEDVGRGAAGKERRRR